MRILVSSCSFFYVLLVVSTLVETSLLFWRRRRTPWGVRLLNEVLSDLLLNAGGLAVLCRDRAARVRADSAT